MNQENDKLSGDPNLNPRPAEIETDRDVALDATKVTDALKSTHSAHSEVLNEEVVKCKNTRDVLDALREVFPDPRAQPQKSVRIKLTAPKAYQFAANLHETADYFAYKLGAATAAEPGWRNLELTISANYYASHLINYPEVFNKVFAQQIRVEVIKKTS